MAWTTAKGVNTWKKNEPFTCVEAAVGEEKTFEPGTIIGAGFTVELFSVMVKVLATGTAGTRLIKVLLQDSSAVDLLDLRWPTTQGTTASATKYYQVMPGGLWYTNYMLNAANPLWYGCPRLVMKDDMKLVIKPTTSIDVLDTFEIRVCGQIIETPQASD